MKLSYIGIFSFLAAARCEGEQSKLSCFSFVWLHPFNSHLIQITRQAETSGCPILFHWEQARLSLRRRARGGTRTNSQLSPGQQLVGEYVKVFSILTLVVLPSHLPHHSYFVISRCGKNLCDCSRPTKMTEEQENRIQGPSDFSWRNSNRIDSENTEDFVLFSSPTHHGKLVDWCLHFDPQDCGQKAADLYWWVLSFLHCCFSASLKELTNPILQCVCIDPHPPFCSDEKDLGPAVDFLKRRTYGKVTLTMDEVRVY